MRPKFFSLAVLFAFGLTSFLPAESKTVIQAEKGKIRFLVGSKLDSGDKLVAVYHYGPKISKPYFWPVNAPNGVTITRGWPMVEAEEGEKTDHVHQKSLWFCHGDVIPEGIEIKAKIRNVTGVDFWSENPNRGQIVVKRVDPPKNEGNHSWVTTHNEWQTVKGMKILDETRTIHLYNLEGSYLLALDIDFHASVCPITFGDTKEGSMGVRVRKALIEAGGTGQLTNADGKVGANECWGRHSAWCDYSGKVGDKEVGVTIMSDPTNPVPSAYHARNYGLLAANPFGRSHSRFPDVKDKTDLVKIAKGDHMKFRFGVLLHDGDAKDANVAAKYKKFVAEGK